MTERAPAMNVVELTGEEKAKLVDSEEPSTELLNALTPEDRLWFQLLKTLDKLERGVEGDMSALGRATRNINRFRKRLPSTTWARILHTIIPKSYKPEFLSLLQLFIPDLDEQSVQLIANLAAVSIDEAKAKLQENNGDVFQSLMEFVAAKEKLAKIEIKKKQEQLKKERLEREKKKGTVVITEEEDKSNATTEASSGNTDSKDDNAMDIDNTESEERDEKKEIDDIKITLLPLKDRKNKRKFYPETYVLLQLLIALELYDREQYKLSLEILERLITFCKTENRRTSDLLSSRLYQFFALCTQRLSENDGLSSIRSFLFENYQRACLQQNENAQAVLIVLILQCYISDNLYSLAHKFVEKAEFPSTAESQYYARYHFYRGCIDCVQLNYSDSLYHLEQSIRRAPQTGTYGFKIATTRWLIVIQLLMGDIPDRNIFKPRFDGKDVNNPMLNEALAPFLDVTECVKEGDLKRYEKVLLDNKELFMKCGLSKILGRLRHNVIKTGLRKINKSYSKISLQDVAMKLGLDSANNAYFIVSKAIRDAVINAKIDYDRKYVVSQENIDIYRTSQPYSNYSQRIKFCLDIRNNAVKNLRYPAKDEEDADRNDKDDDEFVTPEEIAEMIQKHFDEEDEED